MTATLLRSLHVPGRPLVLPNVWDAGTAKLTVEAGCPVVATSSAAVAEALGYTDHEGAPVDEMFAVVRRIASTVDVPVTVDAEAGYGLAPAELVERLLAAGAVGCNLEDTDHAGGGLVPAAKQAEYLAEVRAAAGTDLVVNARVDSFLRADDEQAVLADAVERAAAYFAAGADCVYPILVRSVPVLKSFVDMVPGPVNAVLLPTTSVSELASVGVSRVSLGPGLWRRTVAMIRETLAEL